MADERNSLLVEIGTEELPPSEAHDLAAALAEQLSSALAEADFCAADPEREWFLSPRRLAARIQGVRPRQPDREEERLGPQVDKAFDGDGNPTRAAEGFARSCGVSVADLERIDTSKGERLGWRRQVRGESAAERIPSLVDEVLRRLPAKRRMRWGSGEESFPRPVHWVVCLLGREMLPGTVLGVETGRHTRGHRFHHPEAVDLDSPEEYVSTLEALRVAVDDAEGNLRRRIGEGVQAVARELDGEAELNADLVAEVAALVEWPVPMAGRFEERFLELPDEVIVATLEGHQRYFAVRDGQGRLLPAFITVANLESHNPEVVRGGNERVISPRLDDAMFFWRSDRRRSLEDRVGDLDQVLFQRGLGTLGDKGRRLESLAERIAAEIGADPGASGRAARLARCDLLTEMVGEFPELQGIMGGHYARAEGEPEAVAEAIADQYRPAFSGDRLPASREGLALALADRIDSLLGSFAIGKRPSGNKDPFALRRGGLGLMRLLVESGLELDLSGQLIPWAAEELAGQEISGAGEETVHQEVFDFLMERLRAWYAERGIGREVFNAVHALGITRPLDFDARMRAVSHFLKLDEAGALIAANKRISNILAKASEKNEQPRPGNLDRLEDPAENELRRALAELGDAIGDEPADPEGYRQRLERLADLQGPVDRFFEEVLVMAEDPELRMARLGLLEQLRSCFTAIADVSMLRAGEG